MEWLIFLIIVAAVVAGGSGPEYSRNEIDRAKRITEQNQ